MFQHTSLNSRPTFKLVLGLGLCSLGATMLYFYLRNRDDEDENKSKNKSDKHSVKEVSVKLIVSIEQIPLILGRCGGNLSSIEDKTRTKIRFRDKDENNQFCDITGLPVDVKHARSLILKQIEHSSIVNEEIFVPHSIYMKIMGRCGEAKQEICRVSLAKISIDSKQNGIIDKRRILITGNNEQVNIAKKLIEGKIEEDEELRRDVEDLEQHRELRRSPTNSINSSTYSSQTSLSSHVLPREKIFLSRPDERTMEVYVSAVASPSKFWVQLVGPQSKKLDDLVKLMTEYYNDSNNCAEHVISEPYIGQIVAALFKYDQKWYRAEIVGILPNQYDPNEMVLDLYFVDYGDSEYISPKEVYEMRTDFLTLRFQAIECFLANVKSNVSDSWDPQSIQKFEELTQVASWKKLISRIVTYKERSKTSKHVRDGSPIPGVELFDITEGFEIDIGYTLISQGYAASISDESSHAYYNVSPETSLTCSSLKMGRPSGSTLFGAKFENSDNGDVYLNNSKCCSETVSNSPNLPAELMKADTNQNLKEN